MCNYLLRVSNVHISLCQASEWGISGLQGTFPRARRRLPTDMYKRRLVLKNIIFIHNLQTEVMGWNQIKTVFDPEYECASANIISGLKSTKQTTKRNMEMVNSKYTYIFLSDVFFLTKTN